MNDYGWRLAVSACSGGTPTISELADEDLREYEAVLLRAASGGAGFRPGACRMDRRGWHHLDVDCALVRLAVDTDERHPVLSSQAAGLRAASSEQGNSAIPANPKEAVSRLAQACYYPCPLPRRDAQRGSIRDVRGRLG